MKSMKLRVTLFLVTVAGAFLPGCFGAAGPSTVPVSGTVTYKGVPVEGAQVVFSNSDANGKSAAGMTDGAGRFELKTYINAATNAPGAVPGAYEVSVFKTEAASAGGSSEDAMKAMEAADATGQASPTPKYLLPVKYASPETSGLKADIKGKTDGLKFELTE